ncbi:hypothetical protein ACQP00_33810 [Dactylosporangium sp. CS-047395]|uniref:hypothetical protein n=1 Tax=Dactylosporangium sp. CS-047395 TaxID=3239936 RepID=UPI003D8BCA6B
MGEMAWSAVPQPVRAAVETRLGSTIVAVADVAGGFSEGAAARLSLADGRDVFVKATAHEAVRDFHRREGAIAAGLPSTVPSPPLLFALEHDAWVVLAFAFVTARPARPADLPRVLAAATSMASVLTPAPLRPPTRPRLLPGPALDGDTLLHGDLYLFNALIGPSQVYIVDWAHAWVGPAYGDVLMLMAGSPEAESLCAANPLTRDLPPHAIDAFLAAHGGFLMNLAAAAAAPNLAAMAESLGRASLGWLARRPYSAT